VLFVSHNMAAVKNLCSKGIFLENGKVTLISDIENIINTYSKNFITKPLFENISDKLYQNNNFKLLSVKVLNESNEINSIHSFTQEIKIEFEYEVLSDKILFGHGFNLYNSQNIHIVTSHDAESETLQNFTKKGVYKKSIILPKHFLNEGSYTIDFAIMTYNPFQVEIVSKEIVGFDVMDDIVNGPYKNLYTGKFPGIIRQPLEWQNNNKL
jgi:lipopolysaccharide transport system ATP-binding protein